ncbi:MAG: hypothetical protein JO040_13245 [Gemmatimonadetes bacterium]|nr:hypothetical protein [Gemmatimonadota bacterium]
MRILLPLFFALAIGGAPSLTAQEPSLGLNVQPPSASQTATMLGRVRDLDVHYVRASWWAWTKPADWTWYPRFKAAGIEVLPLVYAGPGTPATAGARIAARYRTLFNAYGHFPYVQLDNEVDGDGPFAVKGGNPYQQGRKWGEQMRIAARLIHAFDPGAKIVTAGVAWNREGVRDWVRGVVSVGGFDVLAIHPYGIGCAGEPLSRYQAVRDQGWKGPIWATEVGVSQAQARYIRRDADAFQAEQMRRCLREDPSRLGYQRLYWFQLTPDGEGWGILRRDGTPRPAYTWLRSRGG